MKRQSSNKIKKPMGSFNIAIFVVILIINLFAMYIMATLDSFSNFSKPIFIAINLIVLIIMLLLNILFISSIKTKKKNVFNTVIILTVVMALLTGYGTFASLKINKNVNKIVVSGDQTQTIEAAIVAKDGVTSVDELNGKTVGVITGAQYTEIGKSNLDSEISVSYVEYADINTLFTSLIADEIDAAIMPSNYVGLFEVVSGYEEALESVDTVTTYSQKVTVTVEKSDKDITSEPFSILVLGVDEGRSDANMLVTVNPISLTITMTSIARDSYVPIACYAGQASDKLGHARVQGVQCTIDTIENLLDVEIDYYFESNFAGVVSIVDALGGIVIDNPYEFVGQNSSDERGHYTVWIPAGENVPVNGEQALAFARERHLYATGDFQRQANQQHVVERILQKAMETRDLNKLLNVLDAAGENVTTNITVDQFISLFNYILEKANRYYDQDNIINMFNIVGSRVTGYNSSVWSESAQLALSIVRPYEGSIEDNHNAIVRNLDLTSAITAPKTIKWDANWEFYAPTISNETYSEQIIQSETPQSYWCTTTGGTWNGSTCACPAGEFVENKGCVQDSASNYTDTASCQGAGFIWDESTNSCVTTCPEGTTSDGKYCRATKADPSTYTNEADCINSGNKWDPTTAKCAATCPSGTDDNDGDGKCTVTQKNASDYKDSSSCVAAGYKWDEAKASCVTSCPSGTTDTNGICKVTPTTTPPTTSPTPSATEKLCTSTGGTWSNGACSCPNEKTWDNTNGCIVKETEEQKCKNNGGEWINGQCVYKSEEQKACESQQGTWSNNTCTCPNGGIWNSGTKACEAAKTEEQLCTEKGGYWYNGSCLTDQNQITCIKGEGVWANSACSCSDSNSTWNGSACVPKQEGNTGASGGDGNGNQPTLSTYSQNLLENNKLSLIEYIFKNLTFINK